MDSRIRIAISMWDEQQDKSALRLAKIVGLLGLSRPRFHKLFKSSVGKSFRQYRREGRMARAVQLLGQHRLSIKAISCECGYGDVSNFYRDFRRTYGMTPQALRLCQLEASGRIGDQNLDSPCNTQGTRVL